MGSSFSFDAKKFEREIMKDVRRETQKFFDSFARQHKGQPVAKVKAALARDWKRKMGGSMSDPELTDYAKLISDGGKIVIT